MCACVQAEEGGLRAYDAFSDAALAEMVPIIERAAAAESPLGAVACFGHAIDSSAVALHVAQALGLDADAREAILQVDQDTVSGILVAPSGVQYLTTALAAATAQ